MLHHRLPVDRFLPLPELAGRGGAARRCGVEIEFAGLSVVQAAELVQGLWGGEAVARSARDIVVEGGAFGRVKVELDISIDRKWAEDIAATALGDLVPVEIVTAPLIQADLPEVERLMGALRAAGALGTQARLAYGFGVHLNVDLPEDAEGIVRVARAFALLEGWLRRSDPLNLTRRVLPFVAPWPPALVDALADRDTFQVPEFAALYAQHAPSRNHGLDLLPALQHLCPDALAAVPPEHLKGGRPTFHYRLPETRLQVAGWTLAYEWNRWCLIETVATLPQVMDALAEAWGERRAQLVPRPGVWRARVEEILASAGVMSRMGAD